VILALLGLGPWAATVRRFGFDRLPYGAMVLVSVVAAGFAVRTYVLFARGRADRALRSLGVSMVVLMGVPFTWYLPGARFLHLSEEAGDYLQSVGATRVGDVYMIDYKEDSLPFYQGGSIRPQPKNAYLATAPPGEWGTYYVVTREIWEQVPASAREHLEVLRSFHGWAYAAKGRVVDVMVLKKK